jgi:predicted nucleotidyltransferase
MIKDKKHLLKICKQNDIVYLGIFGSFVRGDFTEKSDIDLLVRFSKPKSLLNIVKIERVLSELLERKVDLLTEGALSPYLREKILSEMEVFYERSG